MVGLFAVLAIPAWLTMYSFGVSPIRGLPAQYWHAHEMTFGFIPAAIAGFLLTAVPSWTGARGFSGAPLVLITFAWIAGRVAFSAMDVLAPWVVVLLDLSFLPVLAALLAPPLLRARNRNTPMLAVITALWLSDAMFLRAWTHQDAFLALRSLRVGIDIVLTLLTVIGGRIIPSFTANALRRGGEAVEIAHGKALELVIVPLMIAVIVVDAWRPDSRLSGFVAAVVAVAQALRLLGWHGTRTRRDPILWILHIAYAWLPIGFGLKALWLLLGVPWAAYWLHALTVGALATMILAVMSRVALGHTGRELRVESSVAGAYLLLTGGALVRVFGASLVPGHYLPVLTISGLLWTAAFAVFLVVYAPILSRPRVDRA
jgi:uncharacterized protein involved in response to NO